jgi:hypothetical protein
MGGGAPKCGGIQFAGSQRPQANKTGDWDLERRISNRVHLKFVADVKSVRRRCLAVQSLPSKILASRRASRSADWGHDARGRFSQIRGSLPLGRYRGRSRAWVGVTDEMLHKWDSYSRRRWTVRWRKASCGPRSGRMCSSDRRSRRRSSRYPRAASWTAPSRAARE